MTVVSMTVLLAGMAWGGWQLRAHLVVLNERRGALEEDAARLTGERDSWRRSYEQMQTAPPRKCIKGTFYAMGDMGVFNVGEMEICGENMSTSPVMGPSFEQIVRTQEQEIAELVKERDSCAAKPSTYSCSGACRKGVGDDSQG